MISYNQFGKVWSGKLEMLFGRGTFLASVLAAMLVMSFAAGAQVAPSGDRGGILLTAGATVSGYEIQYGQQKLAGPAAVVDADNRRHLGIEAEARWLQYHETNGQKATTWAAGPRYRFSTGKFTFYGKGLVGIGQFTYPYNYARGTYLLISPGAGVDYRWRGKVSFRVADFEYQYWPEFTFGAMSTYGLSAGIRYHIF
ncbi:MAG: hypothetical protein ABSF53_12240 [Terracidiphilus sp.]|jgi:hypothetical protein